MKFKVLAGTKTFYELTKTFDEIEFAHRAAAKLCTYLGGIDYIRGNNCLAGGISEIDFGLNENGKEIRKKGWFKEDPEIRYKTLSDIPENQEVLKLIKDLPTVKSDAFNDIFGISSVYFRVKASDEEIILDVDGINNVVPNKDLTEILTSDYIAIEKRIIERHFSNLGYKISVEEAKTDWSGRYLKLNTRTGFNPQRLINLVEYYFYDFRIDNKERSIRVKADRFKSYGHYKIGICKKCGCTDNNACEDQVTGTCFWVAGDLCSACASDEQRQKALSSIFYPVKKGGLS